MSHPGKNLSIPFSIIHALHHIRLGVHNFFVIPHNFPYNGRIYSGIRVNKSRLKSLYLCDASINMQ
jgi:hypothetical protein